jgi:hypothetical protein
VNLGRSTKGSEGLGKKVWKALSEKQKRTIPELVTETGLSKKQVRKGLATLGSRARRSGLGIKGKSYRYSRAPQDSVPSQPHPPGDSHESPRRRDQGTVAAPRPVMRPGPIGG